MGTYFGFRRIPGVILNITNLSRLAIYKCISVLIREFQYGGTQEANIVELNTIKEKRPV